MSRSEFETACTCGKMDLLENKFGQFLQKQKLCKCRYIAQSMRYDQPGLKMIENMSTIKSYMKGIQYYHAGRVNHLSISDDVVTAKVTGTRKYSVSIVRNYENVILSCTCPYDRDGCCKHIVAVLFSVYYRTGNVDIINNATLDYGLRQRGKGGYGGGGRSMQDYNSPHTTFDESPMGGPLRNLGINRSAITHKGLGVKKADKTANDKIPPSRKCRQRMAYLYKKAKGKNGHISNKNKVTFYSIEDMAMKYNDYGHPEKAIEVYKHMCEYISENIAIVDNMKHYYTEHVRRSLLDAVTIIHRTRLDHAKKRDHIRYFFERYMQEHVGHFALIYFGALLDILDGIEDVQYCKSLFESQILDNKPVVAPDCLQRTQNEILEATFSILEKMEDNNDDMMDFLLTYHEQSESLCIKYIWNLVESDVDEALRITRKASKMFKNPEYFARIQSFIMEQNGDPKQVDILCEIFIATSNWTYYEKIKDISDDWDAQLETMLEHIKKNGNIHTYIDVLLYEKRTDDALMAVLESSRLDLLDAYSGDLASIHPDKYYDKYAEQLPVLLESAMTMRDYENIKRHIDIMRSIPNHVTKSRDLISDLKTRYPQFAEQMES